MLNNLFWSILANRLYYSETWASAKAFMLLNYVTPDAASQTAASDAMEANKTSGAGIVAQGAIAPGSRTQAAAPWYVQDAPYAGGLGSTAGGTVPNTAGRVGYSLVVGADGVPYFAVPGADTGITQLTGDVTAGPGSGSQVTTITNAVKSVGVVGSTPADGGASIATTVLTLQPADDTHPGVVSTAAQTFAGVKTLSSNPAFSAMTTAGVVHNAVTTGALTSSLIINADVDPSAAIAGSKLVAASDSVAGAVTTAAQTFAGLKDFSSGIKADTVVSSTAATLSLLSSAANATAGYKGTILGSSGLLSAGDARIVSFYNANGEQSYINGSGGLVGTTINITGTFTLQAGNVVAANGNSITLYGYANNSSGAKGVIVENQATLSTAGASVLQVNNNSAKVCAVETNGTVFGIYLKSPDGNAWLLTVANGGTLNIAAAP